MSFDEAFLDALVAALHRLKIDAVIVGNTASILHGAAVLTQDVDIVVRDTALNRKKLMKLAVELGGVETRLTDPSSSLDVRRIVNLSVPIDVMFNRIGGGLRFESLRARSVKISVGTQRATVASLEDVIASKEAAGRKKDLAVLPILRDTLAINRAREKREKKI